MQPLHNSGSCFSAAGIGRSLTISRDRDPPAGLEYAEDLPHQLFLLLIGYQVQHAVRDNQIDGGIRNQWLFPTLAGLPCPEFGIALSVNDRMLPQMSIEGLDIQGEILDIALQKADAIPAELPRHVGLVLARQREHVVIHVHPDDPPLWPDQLRRQVTDLAAAAAEIEHDIARLHVTRRVAAAVIPGDNLLRQRRQQTGVIVHRTAQRLLRFPCAL